MEQRKVFAALSKLEVGEVAGCVGTGPGTGENVLLQRKAETLWTDRKVFLRWWDEEMRWGAWLVEGKWGPGRSSSVRPPKLVGRSVHLAHLMTTIEQ